MKTLQPGLWCVLTMALLCVACSKDTDPVISNEQEELVSLSFNISLLDLDRSMSTKQDITDIPDCADLTPFYIEIVLMQEDDEIVGNADTPFRIDLAPNQLFTKDVPEMKLKPGLYYLDHCAVYSEDGTLMCLAPKAGSPMAVYSDAPMPMSINLRAGTKPFPDVPVMCYDNRDVNEYGYFFFDLENIPLRQFCFFANYCDYNGRHYPARYSIDVSINGNSLYTEEINTTGTLENGKYFADPLCIAIPDLAIYDDEEDYVDYTITLLPWEGVYDIDEAIEISGSLSREAILNNFDGPENVEYEHIFFNCNNEEGEIELPDLENATFSDPANITNPYYGPKFPYFYVYYAYELEDGEIPEEPSEIIYVEKAFQTKQILGINTYVQNDRVTIDNITVENTDDWLAQDDEGNLWYMGEDSRNYDEEGNFINNEGSWEAGIDGALPGYWLPANPYIGQRYYQEFYEGEAEDWAEVIALDETVVLEIGSYENVLVTKDVNPFQPGEYELKYYAPDWGLIKEEKYEDGALVEIVILEVLGITD